MSRMSPDTSKATEAEQQLLDATKANLSEYCELHGQNPETFHSREVTTLFQEVIDEDPELREAYRQAMELAERTMTQQKHRGRKP